MSETNNIALIGVGHWGKNHLRVLNELKVLRSVCDLDEEIIAKRKTEYPDLEYTKNFNEILNNPEIKAVVIASSASSHYELAKQALISGKDVLVEKPLALEVEQGKKLVELAEKENRVLMVGHLLHYHPAIVKLKEVIGKEDFGKIRYIWSNRLNFGKLRPEENVLWSFAPHDISLILNILGTPERITAMGRSYLQENIPDTTLSVLEYNDKVAAHIFVSWLNPFKEQKLSVIGSKQMLVFDGMTNELILYPHQLNFKEDKGYEAIKAEGRIVSFNQEEPLTEEIKHFLECIQERKQPLTNGQEGLKVLEVLEACEGSLGVREKGEF